MEQPTPKRRRVTPGGTPVEVEPELTVHGIEPILVHLRAVAGNTVDIVGVATEQNDLVEFGDWTQLPACCRGSECIFVCSRGMVDCSTVRGPRKPLVASLTVAERATFEQFGHVDVFTPRLCVLCLRFYYTTAHLYRLGQNADNHGQGGEALDLQQRASLLAGPDGYDVGVCVKPTPACHTGFSRPFVIYNAAILTVRDHPLLPGVRYVDQSKLASPMRRPVEVPHGMVRTLASHAEAAASVFSTGRHPHPSSATDARPSSEVDPSRFTH